MSERMRIAISGATGRAGRPLVALLAAQGHDVVQMSRSTGVDVITGEGLAEALTGADRIVDLATGPSPDQAQATEFFTSSARNLQGEGERAGVERIVVASIVGIDGFEGGYNVAKLAQEQAMLDGPVPAQILRAAQFHEFIEQMLEWCTQGDVGHVPPMRIQPVAAVVVAEALAELATANGSDPANAVVGEIAGPRPELLPDLARTLVEHRGDCLRVEDALLDDDRDMARMADGALLPGPDAKLAGPTYEEWLKR